MNEITERLDARRCISSCFKSISFPVISILKAGCHEPVMLASRFGDTPDWQANSEDGAPSLCRVAADDNLSPVELDDAPCQRKPHAAALCFASVFTPIQVFEDPLVFIRENAWPAVGDFDKQRPAILPHAHFHGIAWGAKFDRILDHIEESQPEHIPVA